ncbi:MAG: hypothetical protein OXG24_00640 [Gammaproteobacteria bacterium]|nr:hypothetical protein [Gammaproteobacteria bacterium]
MATIRDKILLRSIIGWACSLMLVLCAFSGWACLCVEETLEKEFKDVDLVFSGKVLKSGEPKSETAISIEVEFELDEIWKGDKTGNISVSTPIMQVSCGFPFKVGDCYVVFAYAHDKKEPETSARDWDEFFYTTWCENNQEIDESTESKDLLSELASLKSKHQMELQESKNEEEKQG